MIIRARCSAFVLFIITNLSFGNGNQYHVSLKTNGPAIFGSTVQVEAHLFKSYVDSSEELLYIFEDKSSNKKHTVKTTNTTAYWNLTYNEGEKDFKAVTVEVTVEKVIILSLIKEKLCHNETHFNLTSHLNGILTLKQNGTLRQNYVSTAMVVDHQLTLTTPDYNFVSKNATSVLTFWFIDCIYYGMTAHFDTFRLNYSNPDTNHLVEALTIPYSSPPLTTTEVPSTTVPTTVSTKSTAPTTPTTKTTVSTSPEKPTTNHVPEALVTSSKNNSDKDVSNVPAIANVSVPTSTSKSTSSSVTVNKNLLEINTNEISQVPSPTNSLSSSTATVDVTTPKKTTAKTIVTNTTDSTHTITSNYTDLLVYFPNLNISQKCINPSSIILGLNKTYSFISRKIVAAAPVSNIKVEGAQWLQPQDVLNLTITCNGSSLFTYCVRPVFGLYNVTGNEICEPYQPIHFCHFSYSHFFYDGPLHTVLIFIRNEVSKTIRPVGINIYHAVKQTQLSVIVVPVGATAVAVILIVFGISYYVQSRNRYQIEVADFDFSHASDMEYKTFRERLREAILSAINRTQDFSDQDSSTSSWPPSQSRKYGSMLEPENPS